MSGEGSVPRPLDLLRMVAISAVVLGTVTAAGLAYLLLDVLLVLFLGIVLAAAVQPWHAQLCRRGVPQGWALLLIFLPFLLVLAGLCFVIGPILFEQLSAFATGLPEAYTEFRSAMRGESSQLLRLLGERLPTFDALTRGAAALLPGFFQSALQFTASVLAVFAYFVTVFVVAFYWTLELPRIERLVLSLIPVARRARALTVWHEIELTLGAFMRGQGVLMLIVGVASGIGYALIGLPNVLLLAVLAGLLEAVPVVGPVLAAIPAVLVALPMGSSTVGLTIGLAVLLQAIENNILVPRVMSAATGTSPLVGLLAVLAFGVLYGVVGVFVAIPVAAVTQIMLARMIDAEPPAEVTGTATAPEALLLARVRALQQQVRMRLRQRDSRMGIDPDSADHRDDAVEQQVEGALELLEQMLSSPSGVAADSAERDQTLAGLDAATERLEQALNGFGALTPADTKAANGDDVAPSADALAAAAGEVEEAVEQLQGVVAGVDPAAALPLAPPATNPDRDKKAPQKSLRS